MTGKKDASKRGTRKRRSRRGKRRPKKNEEEGSGESENSELEWSDEYDDFMSNSGYGSDENELSQGSTESDAVPDEVETKKIEERY